MHCSNKFCLHDCAGIFFDELTFGASVTQTPITLPMTDSFLDIQSAEVLLNISLKEQNSSQEVILLPQTAVVQLDGKSSW